MNLIDFRKCYMYCEISSANLSNFTQCWAQAINKKSKMYCRENSVFYAKNAHLGAKRHALYGRKGYVKNEKYFWTPKTELKWLDEH